MSAAAYRSVLGGPLTRPAIAAYQNAKQAAERWFEPSAQAQALQAEKAQLERALGSRSTADAHNFLGKVLLGSLGTGAAVRTLGEVYRLAVPKKKRDNDLGFSGTDPIVIDVPMLPKPITKTASSDPSQPPGYIEWLTKNPTTEKWLAKPWFLPAAVAAGVGGLGLGYAGTDALFNMRRKAELNAEVEDARQRFRRALMSQYVPAEEDPVKGIKQVQQAKLASDARPSVGERLDRLWEKAAKDEFWRDLAPSALGLYGLYALATGTLGHSQGLAAGRKSSDRAAYEKAKLLRQSELRNVQAPEVYARPVAIDDYAEKDPPFLPQLAIPMGRTKDDDQQDTPSAKAAAVRHRVL